MRGRKISPETLREQIQDDGEEFGIVAMDTPFGDVIAGEEFLTVVPLVAGLNILEEVQRDICSVDQSYPLLAVIGSRRKRNERSFAHRSEMSVNAYNRAIEQTKADIYHELKADLKNADRQRVMVAQKG